MKTGKYFNEHLKRLLEVICTAEVRLRLCGVFLPFKGEAPSAIRMQRARLHDDTVEFRVIAQMLLGCILIDDRLNAYLTCGVLLLGERLPTSVFGAFHEKAFQLLIQVG
jgi:hypothetical protein